MRILITGGAGFIGSALARHLIEQPEHEILVLDKLTYAGNLASLTTAAASSRYRFVRADICNANAVADALESFRPDVITHLAAESHVDRSIDGPRQFIQTNVVGTYTMLDAALAYWRRLKGAQAERFRFHHISTDEVFGSLGAEGAFNEETPYDPRSPYSASKAGSDHLVSAWWHTYGLPVLITNCSNNYGPYQFPEKLIPLMVIQGLAGRPLPVYGQGSNIRDWLYVDDHVRALQAVFESGRPGESYAIGGACERRNLDVVHTLCDALDALSPRGDGRAYHEQITHVADRPGHDQRYAIDASKIRRELGWSPAETFESGLKKTVEWYLTREDWWGPLVRERAADRRQGLGNR